MISVVDNLEMFGDNMTKKLPRILIAGTNSGCGKTTMVCGILQALKNRKQPIAAFKCGPDYIDPMFHSSIIGTRCRNLDLQFFDENTLRYLLARENTGETAVIEGVMGYYDGVSTSCKASSYAAAKAAQAPAVLVVNARGAAHSILATIHGFATLYPDSGIRGVILNNCSAMLYPRLKQEIESRFADIQPLGFLPPLPDCTLESRHLGLITAAEVADLQEKLQKLAQAVEQYVDLDGLLALAQSAPALEYEMPELPEPGTSVRIGVAKDKAFCFYYEDNLSLLEQLGAELVPFSPLEDSALPEELDGLYLGGGYPELYTKQLSENTSMLHSIRNALEAGLPCIAECGGFMYLQEKLLGDPMVGFCKGECFHAGKLVRFGYTTLTAKEDNLLCKAGESLPAHEFHYYDVTNPGDGFTARKSSGKPWLCGVVNDHFYAGFPHFHFYANPNMAARFLDACRKEKNHD